MALHKIKDYYPDYKDQLDDHDVVGYSLYANNDKVGSVDDLLVDDDGKFRYLVVNTGAWIFGKKVLLPIGKAQIDYSNRRVQVTGLTREQVENLPEYDGSLVDYDHEEKVRGVYRPGYSDRSGAALDSPVSLDATPGRADRNLTPAGSSMETYDRDSYTYDRDMELYDIGDRNQNLKLYEERLIADKSRRRTGAVAVGKHTETETVNVSVPVEKERVVIERVTPSSEAVSGTDAFREGEVVRMEVYEETPDIRKETFVREEVKVRKEVERNTVDAQETIRKERLSVDKDGNPIVQE